MKCKGFTLVELLIVVAVIGILAGIAVPSYERWMNESRRTDGYAALIGLQAKMEKFRGSCARYPSIISKTEPTSCATKTINYPTVSDSGFYKIEVTGNGSNNYVIRAHIQNQQAGDTNCEYLWISVTNVNPKGHKGGTSSNCW